MTSGVFEIEAKDLAGRVGRLYVKSGVVETPALFPVVDPRKQEVPTDVLKKYFMQVITNSYFIYKLTKGSVVDVKKLLEWDGVVMTDSGAYQIMRYGAIDVDPDEVLLFQSKIGSDIGVILDLPFDYEEPYTSALLKVEETIRRAKKIATVLKNFEMLVVAPIQGGVYPDLLARSAKELSKLPFSIYAIGSPTTLMEDYRFDLVLDIVLQAKANMAREAPLHLFGAGHPLILPFAVALGADLFDSASYILYARDDRIMLRDRTLRLEDVKTEYLPCSTKLCNTPVKELKEMPREERVLYIAEHNLAILREELLEIKQRIYEGTLWEYLEIKARAHPTLYRFLQALRKYRKFLELYDPETHPRPHGLFFYHDTATSRPEPLRHYTRLNNVTPPSKVAVVIKVEEKPYNRSWQYRYVKQILGDRVHVLFYDPVFGVVPEEVAEVYPLSQNETEGDNEEARARLYEWLQQYDVVYTNIDIPLIGKKVIRISSLDDLRGDEHGLS
ncbi:MAG: tRNA guanosine(15) transglycosylase TgtA [Pyrobaculum sp.]